MAEVHERKFKALLGQANIPKEVDDAVNKWVSVVKEDRLQYLNLCARARGTQLPKYNFNAWKKMEITQDYAVVQEKNLKPSDQKKPKQKGVGVYLADFETGWIIDSWPTLKMAHKTFSLYEAVGGSVVDQYKFNTGLDKNRVYQVVKGPKVWFGRLETLKIGVRDVGLVTRWQDEVEPEDLTCADQRKDSHEGYEPETSPREGDNEYDMMPPDDL